MPRRAACLKAPTRRSSARISCRNAAVWPFAWATMRGRCNGRTRRLAMRDPSRPMQRRREGLRSGAIAEALNTKGVALARLGRNGEAVREVERSVAVAEAAGLQSVVCRAYTNLGVLYASGRSGARHRGLPPRPRGAHRIGDLGFQARLSPISRSPAARSPTAAARRVCLPPKRRSRSTGRSTSASTSAVPLTVLAQIHQCHGRRAGAPLLPGGARGGARNGRAAAAVSLL